MVGLMLALVMIDLVLRLLKPDPSEPLHDQPERLLSEENSYATAGSSPDGDAGSENIKATRVSALQFLKQQRILSAAYGIFLGQVFMTSFDGLLPRFTQNYDWSEAGAGFIFLALSLPSLAAALAGKLSD